MRDRFQGAPAPGFIASAIVKLGLMGWGIHVLAHDRSVLAVVLVAVIVAITGIERFTGSVHNRAFASVINRFAYLPVLLYLATHEIHSDPRFPFLVVLAVGFIVAKEIAFLFNGIRFLMRTEQYMAPKSMRGLNAAALLAVIALFALHLEPAASLVLIAVVVISIADASGFAWNFYKKKHNLRDMNLATKITLMRLLLSPVFMIVYFYDRNPNFGDNSLLLQVIAVLLSILLISTDGLDGYFARKRNEVTKFGKYLDPFSDKICTLTVFLCFVASNYVPVWMVALIFYREAA
ncbi:MAG: CDP-alcohol phosphatidyltransferase family protein, partial [Fibrobacterota bacterium]